MNSLITEDVIEEKKYENNVAYVLKDSSMYLQTEYKVLQNQVNDCFVKCMKLLYNGKIQIYYMASGDKNLTSMLPSLDADSFITIISNLFCKIIEVKNNGFLSCCSIDISFDRIYVDPNTYKVRLVYLPINRRMYHDETVFENELRTSIVKLISDTSIITSPKTIQFSRDLSNGMLPLEEMCGKQVRKIKSSESKTSISRMPEQSKLRLVTMNAPVRVSIEVNKDNFIIGKNASSVDGVVSFNKMISRVHCKVNKSNCNYSITDMGSANGTFVNGKKLSPNTSCEIRNGDIVRLANSDFQVELG